MRKKTKTTNGVCSSPISMETLLSEQQLEHACISWWDLVVYGNLTINNIGASTVSFDLCNCHLADCVLTECQSILSTCTKPFSLTLRFLQFKKFSVLTKTGRYMYILTDVSQKCSVCLSVLAWKFANATKIFTHVISFTGTAEYNTVCYVVHLVIRVKYLQCRPQI